MSKSEQKGLKRVPEKINFPDEEVKIGNFWRDIKAFETQLEKTKNQPEFVFYDGPPFATGLPHYGHILAGSIKDIVTRYQSQNGRFVSRRFGWDCHGLPIEYEIDKEYGVKTKEDVLKMGIDKYNEACRSIVMRYSGEWERIVTRLGRWIDFENDYKTMNLSFMESVWWVFGEIYKQGYVFQGVKVMPYSTACTTPLSNFEANQAYKDVDDPSVFVAFQLADDPNVAFAAWTTTPWTLPSNLALAVNPKFEYVKVFDKKENRYLILMEKRLSQLYKTAAQYEIKEKFLGETLAGKKYLPLFPYFYEKFKETAFRVILADYVTDDSGTGVVHQAPAFGADDYLSCIKQGVIEKGGDLPLPVDPSGKFTSEVSDFAGRYVKDADKDIVKYLKDQKRVLAVGTIHHSYPFCWRSDTPLIYRAVPSWFIDVPKVADLMLKNCDDTYWVPEVIKAGRFRNWISSPVDWCISRNRYWGTPIPLWISEDGQEIVCVSSIAELEKLSGVTGINDIHRHKIDHITIPSQQGRGPLRRIDEVFDCWFESGSMPYAQTHYPFERKEHFESHFPADFIAEGVDQTRGWFYTLLVISTLLFKKPPYRNLIVNGLVLAADGKKMSKRLKNYPDPMNIVNSYGADALRLYLINSPVVRAEQLKFQESGVANVRKDIFLPWFNAYRFLVEQILYKKKR